MYLEERDDILLGAVCPDVPAIDKIIRDEESEKIRRSISLLSGCYRKALVLFYYDELPMRDIAERLGLTEGMVKFYLRAGKKKLKEAFDMMTTGEKSFNPSEFSVYKWGIDFSKVDVWSIFRRKLPCQIAIICHDGAKTVSEISAETGTPSVYIEDELEILMDAGLMISPAKGKYRTNLHILKSDTASLIKKQFEKLYEKYVPKAIKAYESYSYGIKNCDIFKFDAAKNQWAWFYALSIPNFDQEGHYLSDEDYPMILSDGSRAFICAEACKSPEWTSGQTPRRYDGFRVLARDITAFGNAHRQIELSNSERARALYDVYRGNINESDKEFYAELIKENYVIKTGGKLICNMAVSPEKSRELFKRICDELAAELKELCVLIPIRENISKIVSAALPEQLKPYAKGSTETWISILGRAYFLEALHKAGFIGIPDKDNDSPVACVIEEM